MGVFVSCVREGGGRGGSVSVVDIGLVGGGEDPVVAVGGGAGAGGLDPSLSLSLRGVSGGSAMFATEWKRKTGKTGGESNRHKSSGRASFA